MSLSVGPALGDWNRDAVKVCDFGIAAVLEPDLTKITRSGEMVGTPVYPAPEQCRGEDATPARDVFSFGTVLYAMPAGGSPFAGQGGWELAPTGLQYKQPAPIAEVRRDVPEALAELIEAMMAKSADARPSVSEERRALASPFVLMPVVLVATPGRGCEWRQYDSPSVDVAPAHRACASDY